MPPGGETLLDFLQGSGGNPFAVVLFLVHKGAYIVFYPVLVYMLWKLWLLYVGTVWGEKQKTVLMAINVPKENEQSMVAIEQVFAHLSGPHQNYTWLEIHWDGAQQYTWSLELVSIDGYVQYMIRSNVKMRDVVEAAIYAQYPDAEIMQVDDYTKNVPHKFPHPDWEMWGVELAKTAEHVYPIRTYKSFEDKLPGVFADPMAAMLEIFGNLGPGEQLWFQIVMTPTDHHWYKRAEKIVAKIVGAKVKHEKHFVDTLADAPIGAINLIGQHVLGTGGAGEAKKPERDGPPNQMLYLTPGERATLEAIQMKITKVAFFCKLRFIYIAKKEVSRRRTIVSSMFGAIKQFNTIDMNGFKPGKRTKTTAEWLFADYRKNMRRRKIMHAYSGRDNEMGEGEGILLNIEEIATIWHFPMLTVKAPSVSKAEAKKGEPPPRLPIERVVLPSGEVAYRAGAAGAVDVPEAQITAAPGAGRIHRQRAPVLPKGFNTQARSGAPKLMAAAPQPTEPIEDAQLNVAPAVSEVELEDDGKGTPPPNLPFV